jgi:hypothetical protein
MFTRISFVLSTRDVQRTELSLAYFNTARLRNYATSTRHEVTNTHTHTHTHTKGIISNKKLYCVITLMVNIFFVFFGHNRKYVLYI